MTCPVSSQYCSEVSSTCDLLLQAVEMLELFLECMPDYNIDRPDRSYRILFIPL